MTPIQRIALVTDFGPGPYVGQMRLRLGDLAPDVPVLDLISDLPPFRPDLAAYLLPALARDIAAGTLYLCVVDPGVGGQRAALALEADGNWYVGPDNGLLVLAARRAAERRLLRVDWRRPGMSESFHGRDLFAPIAATIACGAQPAGPWIPLETTVGAQWADDLPRIVYVDHYGNLMTGLRARTVPRSAILRTGTVALRFARTFCEVPAGGAFWYENAFGLVELAVNQGRADRILGLAPGDAFDLHA